ncbi:MAG TPA: hypothetical protein VFO30_03025 [Chthoniobacterales bacterium]|nr:hypothetical protein [Chthoniobacterales bacterium]
MAQEPRQNNSPEQLSAEIARTREAVTRNLTGLRYELDFPRKIRRSFRQETMLWIGAAVAVGILIAVVPARTKKVYVEPKIGKKSKHRLLEAGFVLGALKIAASLLRPVIVDFVRARLIHVPPPRPLPAAKIW